MVHRPSRRSAPFDFVRGIPAPGRYAPDRLDPHQAAEAIRHAPVEIGYGFDARRRQVFRHVGDGSRILGMRAEDLAAIQCGLFVHNHPPYDFSVGDPRRRAGSFSPYDLTFMYEHDLSEMILVTVDRTYLLRRPEGGFYLDPGEIENAYARFFDDVHRRLKIAAASGVIPAELSEARGTLADSVMEELRPYFEYRWHEVSSDDA
jgi:hypothetical protein